MTTKKQKRLAGRARREQFLQDEKERGLAEIRKDEERRRAKELDEWRDNHNKNHTSREKRVRECPHCCMTTASEMAEARKQKRLAAVTLPVR